VRFDETLCMPSRLEPPHAPLALAGWLMRVLGPVIKVSVLSMSNAGHDRPFRGGIAAQLVGNDHARTSPSGSQQLTEEPHCSEAVTLWLNKNIDDDAVLIDGSPEIMRDAGS
jgi:hypothetical protein